MQRIAFRGRIQVEAHDSAREARRMHHPIEALENITATGIAGIRNRDVGRPAAQDPAGDVDAERLYSAILQDIRLTTLSELAGDLCRLLEAVSAFSKKFCEIKGRLGRLGDVLAGRRVRISAGCAAWVERNLSGRVEVIRERTPGPEPERTIAGEDLEEVLREVRQWLEILLDRMQAKDAALEPLTE